MNHNCGRLVVDVVDDAIVANADPVRVNVGEFFHSSVARIYRKGVEFFENPPSDCRLKFLNLAFGGSLNLYTVRQPKSLPTSARS